jgi:hypothetical protein
MILNAHFSYRMGHVPPRKRKTVWSDVSDAVPVSINEFSSEQAPIALTVTSGDGRDGAVRRDLMMAGGRLVERVGVGGGPGGAELRYGRNNQKFVLKDATQGLPPGAAAFSGSKVVEDSRDEHVAEIFKVASDCCVVDGALCQVVDEPVWHVISNERFAAVVLRHHPMPSGETYPGAAIYRIDRREAAVAHAVRRAVAVGVAPSDVTVTGEVSILRPEALRFDDEGYSLVEAAREAVMWRQSEDRHDLDGQMAEFDLALATGRGTEGTAKALDDLLEWLSDEGLVGCAEKLVELAERRKDIPETAMRRQAEIDAAIGAADMDMLR